MKLPRSSIRLSGVQEQFDRAELFLEQALGASEFEVAFRNLLASVHFGRSAVDLMRRAAKYEQLTVTPAEFDEELGDLLTRYRIVKTIREVDFHDEPLTPSLRMQIVGRVDAPEKREAEFVIDRESDPPRVYVRGELEEGEYTFLLTFAHYIQTEDEPHAVSLVDVMTEYLAQMPAAISRFKQLLRDPGGDYHAPPPKIHPDAE